MKLRRRREPHATWAVDPSLYTVVPDPAPPVLPPWWRRLGRSAGRQDMEPHGTVKTCFPFRDALLAGWVVKLPADTRVRTYEDGRITAHWEMLRTAAAHGTEQVAGMLPSDWRVPCPMKWESPWVLTLPPGYSALYTHPLNDFHLPFRTLSGIVEEDTYPSSINLPWVWVGPCPADVIIPKGTPIAQVIPFRREDWSMEVREMTPPEVLEFQREQLRVHTAGGVYGERNWRRKRWGRPVR